MKKVIYCIALFFLVTSCAQNKPITKLYLVSIFSKEETSRLASPGINSIKGSSLMRQVGGGVVTCAGQQIALIPATNYASERMRYIYGSDKAGYRSVLSMQNSPPAFSETDPDYLNLQKNTLCDAQGFFKFEKIADGDFFLLSTIAWKADPNSFVYEGGTMLRKVHVEGGEMAELVIAP
jgi:hypothetical protein